MYLFKIPIPDLRLNISCLQSIKHKLIKWLVGNDVVVINACISSTIPTDHFLTVSGNTSFLIVNCKFDALGVKVSENLCNS